MEVIQDSIKQISLKTTFHSFMPLFVPKVGSRPCLENCLLSNLVELDSKARAENPCVFHSSKDLKVKPNGMLCISL